MAHLYRKRTGAAAALSAALEPAGSAGEGALAGDRQLRRKLKERLRRARLDGGKIVKYRPEEGEELDDSSVGLKRRRDDAPAVKSVCVKSATWLNRYLDNVDYIDNIQLERMAKAQAEVQLRDEIGLSRRAVPFDPTWGRGAAHGCEVRKGLNVWNAMSPSAVTHRNPAAVASAEYPHTAWCTGQCGMTCNAKGALQQEQMRADAMAEAQATEDAGRRELAGRCPDAGPPRWGPAGAGARGASALDRAIAAAAEGQRPRPAGGAAAPIVPLRAAAEAEA